MLTPAQELVIQQAGLAVWDYVAYDYLTMGGERPKGIVIARSEVIQVVMDAGRLQDELQQRRADPAVLAVVTAYTPENSRYIQGVLRKAFSYAHYGL